MRSFNFDGFKLSKALEKTFNHRKTSLPDKYPIFDEEIYDDRSDRHTLWKAFINKNDLKSVPDKLSNIAKQIEGFIGRPIEALIKKYTFNKAWIAPGPWK